MMISEEEIIYDCPFPLKKSLIISGRAIEKVNIDSHAKKHEKHGVTKKIVIELVKLLNT